MLSSGKTDNDDSSGNVSEADELKSRAPQPVAGTKQFADSNRLAPPPPPSNLNASNIVKRWEQVQADQPCPIRHPFWSKIRGLDDSDESRATLVSIAVWAGIPLPSDQATTQACTSTEWQRAILRRLLYTTAVLYNATTPGGLQANLDNVTLLPAAAFDDLLTNAQIRHFQVDERAITAAMPPPWATAPVLDDPIWPPQSTVSIVISAPAPDSIVSGRTQFDGGDDGIRAANGSGKLNDGGTSTANTSGTATAPKPRQLAEAEDSQWPAWYLDEQHLPRAMPPRPKDNAVANRLMDKLGITYRERTKPDDNIWPEDDTSRSRVTFDPRLASTQVGTPVVDLHHRMVNVARQTQADLETRLEAKFAEHLQQLERTWMDRLDQANQQVKLAENRCRIAENAAVQAQRASGVAQATASRAMDTTRHLDTDLRRTINETTAAWQDQRQTPQMGDWSKKFTSFISPPPAIQPTKDDWAIFRAISSGLPRYSGTGSFQEWFLDFEARARSVTTRQRAWALGQLLEGVAAHLYLKLPSEVTSDYEKLVTNLFEFFHRPRAPLIVDRSFTNCVQRPGMDTKDYLTELRSKLSLIPGLTSTQEQEMLKQQFFRGLSPTLVNYLVAHYGDRIPEDLNSVVTWLTYRTSSQLLEDSDSPTSTLTRIDTAPIKRKVVPRLWSRQVQPPSANVGTSTTETEKWDEYEQDEDDADDEDGQADGEDDLLEEALDGVRAAIANVTFRPGFKKRKWWTPGHNSQQGRKAPSKPAPTAAQDRKRIECYACGEEHFITNCPQYQEWLARMRAKRGHGPVPKTPATANSSVDAQQPKKSS